MEQQTANLTITVDASDIDNKFITSIEQLNAGLTEMRRALNLTHSEQGLLTNAFEQCVDALGRVRSMQDEFIEGLNNAQIALEQYAEELDEIYSTAVELVRQTENEANALENQTRAISEIQKEGEAAVEGYNSLSVAALNVGEAFKSVGTHTPFKGIVIGCNEAIGAVEYFNNAVKNIRKAEKSLYAVTNALNNWPIILNRSSKAFGALAGAIGRVVASSGPIGWIALALTGIKTALDYFTKKKEHENWSDSFKEISAEAYKAGREIKTLGDAFEFGAGRTKKNDVQKALDEYAALRATGYTKEEREAVEHYENMGGVIGKFMAYSTTAATEFNHLFGYHGSWFGDELGDQLAAAMDVVNQYVESIQSEKKTEAEKLSDELKTIRAIEATGELHEEQKKVLEQKADELREAIKTSTLKEAGVCFEKIKTSAETFDGNLTKLSEIYLEGRLSVEDVNAGQKNLAEAFANSVVKEAKSRDEIAAAQEKLKEARAKSRITEEAYAAANQKLQEAAGEKLAVERKELENRLGAKIGEKTAEQELAEKYKELAAALECQTIDEIEYNAFKEKLSGKYKDALEGQLGVKFEEASAEQELAEKYQKLKDALDVQNINEEEYNAAKSKLTDKYKENLESKIGVKFEEQTPEQEIEERLILLKKALESDLVTEEQYAKANAKLAEQYHSAKLEQYKGLAELIEAGKEALSAEEQYAEDVAMITSAFEDAAIDRKQYQEAMNAADKRLADAEEELAREKEEEARRAREEAERIEAERAAQHAAKLEELGYSELIDYAASISKKNSDPYAEAQKQYRALADAYKRGVISQEEFNEATDAWRKIRKEHAEQEEKAKQEQKEQAKKDARSNLGVDSLMESLKTPLEKYRETMDKIEKAAKIHAIDRDERAALEDKAADDYWEAMGDASVAGDYFEKTADAMRKSEKFQLGRSMENGSEALYLAQVRNSTANFQSRIQSSAERLADAAEETLYQSQQTNFYMQTMLENQGAGAAVWG